MHEEQLTQARASVASAQQARLNAESAAQQARADADQARSQADAERAARMQAEADAASARERARQAEQNVQARAVAPPPPPRIVPDRAAQADHEKSEMRMRLLEQLNGALATRDTAWGLMVTVPDRLFADTNLRPLSFDQLRRVSTIVTGHPGLRVVVEGHSDNAGNEAMADRRAQVVRDQLVASGLPSSIVEVRRMGDSRPLGSNNTEAGREENRRVEVIISGDPIGKFPFWDHPYTLTTTTGSQQH
jgi:outer membrane protein OmpA-like peptidoglycan-associated protein